MEEAEYLESLSHFHWLVYPWFKLMEAACDKVFGCKRKCDQENERRRAEVQARQVERQRKRLQEMEE